VRQEQEPELHLLVLGEGADGKMGGKSSGTVLLRRPQQVRSVSEMSTSGFKKTFSKEIITMNW